MSPEEETRRLAISRWIIEDGGCGRKPRSSRVTPCAPPPGMTWYEMERALPADHLIAAFQALDRNIANYSSYFWTGPPPDKGGSPAEKKLGRPRIENELQLEGWRLHASGLPCFEGAREDVGVACKGFRIMERRAQAVAEDLKKGKPAPTLDEIRQELVEDDISFPESAP